MTDLSDTDLDALAKELQDRMDIPESDTEIDVEAIASEVSEHIDVPDSPDVPDDVVTREEVPDIVGAEAERQTKGYFNHIVSEDCANEACESVRDLLGVDRDHDHDDEDSDDDTETAESGDDEVEGDETETSDDGTDDEPNEEETDLESTYAFPEENL